jgi:transposase-like protein
MLGDSDSLLTILVTDLSIVCLSNAICIVMTTKSVLCECKYRNTSLIIKMMMNRPICPNCKSDDVLEYPSTFRKEKNSFICNSCSFQWKEIEEGKK